MTSKRQSPSPLHCLFYMREAIEKRKKLSQAKVELAQSHGGDCKASHLRMPAGTAAMPRRPSQVGVYVQTLAALLPSCILLVSGHSPSLDPIHFLHTHNSARISLPGIHQILNTHLEKPAFLSRRSLPKKPQIENQKQMLGERCGLAQVHGEAGSSHC